MESLENKALSEGVKSETEVKPKQRMNKYYYHNLPQSKKLFVGGLPEGITSEEFETYISKFGTITDHVVIHNKLTRKPRGFGFVSFDSHKAVNDVLQNRFHIIKNKQVEIVKAQPKQDLNNLVSNTPNYNYNYNYVSPQQPQYYYYDNYNQQNYYYYDATWLNRQANYPINANTQVSYHNTNYNNVGPYRVYYDQNNMPYVPSFIPSYN